MFSFFIWKNGTVECWPLNIGMLGSQWNGPVKEILERRLGGQSCVRAGNEQGRGGGVGTTHPMRCRDRSLRGGERIYEDFSFLALGESAAWEFTPLTPLAKSQNKNRIIYHITITSEGKSQMSFQRGHWCFGKTFCAHISPLSFFDLLLEGAGFFFKVWVWPCSLHRRSWKLMNFHIMKTWERQMAARTVILREKSQWIRK